MTTLSIERPVRQKSERQTVTCAGPECSKQIVLPVGATAPMIPDEFCSEACARQSTEMQYQF